MRFIAAREVEGRRELMMRTNKGPGWWSATTVRQVPPSPPAGRLRTPLPVARLGIRSTEVLRAARFGRRLRGDANSLPDRRNPQLHAVKICPEDVSPTLSIRFVRNVWWSWSRQEDILDGANVRCTNNPTLKVGGAPLIGNFERSL